MRVHTKTVKEVVEEASVKMKDPNYSAVMVGGFVQQQTATSHYIGAHEEELGGTEHVVNTIFHAALLALCYQRAGNRSLPEMSFEDLDYVAGDEVSQRLQTLQPAISEYIAANVEHPSQQRVLQLVALAMDWVS